MLKFLLLLLTCFSLTAFSQTIPPEKIVLTSTNHVLINQAITQKSVAKAQLDIINVAQKTPENEPIYLVLDSPGGSVSAGRLLIDTINALPHKVHTISLFAASMAYIIAQNLDTRYVLPSSTLMSHRMRIGGLSGQVPGELEARLKNVKQMGNEIDSQIANRIGISFKDYRNSIYDELWLTGYSSVFFNHADKIASVTCDKSLNGTHFKDFIIFGLKIQVEFANCPLIGGFLSIKVPQRKAKKVKQEFLKKYNNRYENIQFTL